MKEPGARIIRDETDGHIISRVCAYGDDVAPDRIHEIRRIATRNSHDIEFMLKRNSARDNKKGGMNHIRRADVWGAGICMQGQHRMTFYKCDTHGKTRGCSRVREAYFYNFVRGKFIDTSAWQEL